MVQAQAPNGAMGVVMKDRPTLSAPSSSRPISSTNLLASIANARFKTFQVQYEILSKNAILSTIAAEIPWKNLLDLFVLKFFAVGDVLWRQNEHANEMAFVLCGGFLARRLEIHEDDGSASSGEQTLIAERIIRPGGSIAALAVHTNVTRLPYTIVTAKFKSILLALPVGKYKSVLRQLSLETSSKLQQALYENENKLRSALRLGLVVPPGERAAAAMDASSHKAPVPGLSGSASLGAFGMDGTTSWASLHVAKPVEFQVNSSLLILHESASTGNVLVPSSQRKKALPSSVARLTAQKHTQRRLQSIKLPATVDAFPSPANRHLESVMDLGRNPVSYADIVPKSHIGRLLKPLKKPAMLSYEDEVNVSESSDRRLGRRRRLLVADRTEYFRDLS